LEARHAQGRQKRIERASPWSGALTCGRGPALAGLWVGFGRSKAGFFCLGHFREILLAKFFDLGRNLEGKRRFREKYDELGLQIFWQNPRHQIYVSKPQKSQQIQRSNFEAILGLFFGFSKFMVEITNKSKSVATKSC
jgi:hypothetical protein